MAKRIDGFNKSENMPDYPENHTREKRFNIVDDDYSDTDDEMDDEVIGSKISGERIEKRRLNTKSKSKNEEYVDGLFEDQNDFADNQESETEEEYSPNQGESMHASVLPESEGVLEKGVAMLLGIGAIQSFLNSDKGSEIAKNIPLLNNFIGQQNEREEAGSEQAAPVKETKVIYKSNPILVLIAAMIGVAVVVFVTAVTYDYLKTLVGIDTNIHRGVVYVTEEGKTEGGNIITDFLDSLFDTPNEAALEASWIREEKVLPYARREEDKGTDNIAVFMGKTPYILEFEVEEETGYLNVEVFYEDDGTGNRGKIMKIKALSIYRKGS